jgi:hypothetical protein
MNSKKLIDEIVTLPVEDRIAAAEVILRSLNVPDTKIDASWASVAEQRRRDLQEKRVDSISLEDVKRSVARRFSS